MANYIFQNLNSNNYFDTDHIIELATKWKSLDKKYNE